MDQPTSDEEWERRGKRAELVSVFWTLYDRLPENRKEYVRDEVWEADTDLWSLFFQESEGRPDIHGVPVQLLQGAVGLARYQVEFSTKLPLEYRE